MASIKYKTNEGYVSIPLNIIGSRVYLEDYDDGEVVPELVDDNAKLGNGIGTCSTSSGTALEVTLDNYKLVKNGIVAVTFENDVPANATLNINNKGAKPIYNEGSAIEANVIKAGKTVMFAYDGTNYVVTSIEDSATGLEIVAASGTTLNAEVGKYYRYDNDVTTLAVTLPTITGATKIKEFKIYFHTLLSGNPSVTFTGGTIKKLDELKILENSTYEIDVTWNGTLWTIHTNENLIYDSVIDYLKCTGTQWIDTQFTAENGNIMDYEAVWTEYEQHLVASHNTPSQGGDNGYNRNFVTALSETKIDTEKTTNIAEPSFSISLNTKYHIYYDTTGTRKLLKINGQVIEDDTAPALHPLTTVKVFFLDWDGGVKKGIIYWLKLYNSEGVLVRDFIPVRKGNIGFLYDKVSRTLFGNSGTGAFVLGPDV